MKSTSTVLAVASTALLAIGAVQGTAAAQSSNLDLLGLGGLVDAVPTGSLPTAPMTGSDNMLNAAAGSMKSNTPGQTNDAFTGSINSGGPNTINPIYGSLSGLGAGLMGSLTGTDPATIGGTINGSLGAGTQVMTGSAAPLGALATASTDAIKTGTSSLAGSSSPDTSSLTALSTAVTGSLKQGTASQAGGTESLTNLAGSSSGSS